MDDWDPRPQWTGSGVEAWRCANGHVTAERVRRCPVCREAVEAQATAPSGEVWSWTICHLEADPYGLAYVDLNDGPRVLARFDARHPLEVGGSVRVAPNLDGDLEVVPA